MQLNCTSDTTIAHIYYLQWIHRSQTNICTCTRTTVLQCYKLIKHHCTNQSTPPDNIYSTPACAITQARPQRRAAAPAPVSRRRGRWLSGRSRWWAGPPPAPVSPVPSPWERPASSQPPLHTFESREDVRTSENQLLVLVSSAHRRNSSKGFVLLRDAGVAGGVSAATGPVAGL